MTFDAFFRKATNNDPFPYQRGLAEASQLPESMNAPTGSGKTAAAMLSWLWRRSHGPKAVRRSTPRRLVYCLPMRVLVEQTRDCAVLWLHRLDLLGGRAEIEEVNGNERVRSYSPSWSDPGRVAVSVLMGGEEPDEWDAYPEREAIIIGTQDMLLSRALNRGYGMSRYRWPMHFGLLNNDSLWVFDEIQLMSTGLATSAQLAAFREILGTMRSCSTLWMSATLRQNWLETVDFRDRASRLEPAELKAHDRKVPGLGQRLTAKKPLSVTASTAGNSKALANEIRDAHQPGSLTLVVVNTVERACDLYAVLSAAKSRWGRTTARGRGAHGSESSAQAAPQLLLLHSRFRSCDREKQMQALRSEVPSGGRIVVSTQVVEAGVDISARILFTELAPWPSLVQRFGRCNRYGEYEEGAGVFWVDVSTGRKSKAAPYDDEELNPARRELRKLKDVGPVSLEKHLAALRQKQQSALFPYSPAHVIRRKDAVELFDTTPDLAGNDIDVSRFIREGPDTDVQVFWREVRDDAPAEDEPGPTRAELCPVPFREFTRFLGDKKQAYRWDFLEEKWVRAHAREIFPGQVYLVVADAGGYSEDRGWDGKTVPVVPLPEPQRGPQQPEANSSDRYASGEWETIAEHTNRVAAELENLMNDLGVEGEPREILLIAARWHDRGKAHEVFQGALPDGKPREDLWAKAQGRFKRYRRKHFRHEIASALAMLQAGLPDLASYLAAAHHGKVRLSIRSLPGETRPQARTRFARGVWEGDALPVTNLGAGMAAPAVTLLLEPMELGLSADGRPSWAERALALLHSLGPYSLAYLEALLRAADMRGSGVGSLQGGH